MSKYDKISLEVSASRWMHGQVLRCLCWYAVSQAVVAEQQTGGHQNKIPKILSRMTLLCLPTLHLSPPLHTLVQC